MDVRHFLIGGVGIMGLCTAVGAQTAVLHPLGSFGDRDVASYAYGLSSDGVHIVGGCVVPTSKGPPITMRASRWRYPVGGVPSSAEALPVAATQTDFGSLAVAVSDDGERVVGSVGLTLEFFFGLVYSPWQGMYWWDISSPTAVADWTTDAMEFTDISADGAVVCGTTREGGFEPAPGDPIMWTGPGNAPVVLGSLGGVGQAFAISADGRTIVGESFNAEGGAVNSFMWTSEAGLFQLPNTDSNVWHTAMGMSADGHYVVGGLGADASVWTEQGGMINIGREPGSTWAFAVDAALDGSVVGYSVTDGDTRVLDAFLWDAANGMRRIADVLTDDYGLDVTGWHFDAATAIADDGRTIIGYGAAPGGRTEGWVVRLGEKGCRADFNTDGAVNSQDFFDFLTAFFAADPRADFNADNAVNSQDFFDFLAVFFVGC